MAFGVGLCVVSPVPVTLAGIMDAGEATMTFCAALLLVVVAAGIFLFVRDGMVMRGLKKIVKRISN